jgi:GNAT superfamily N-acetyltransferase
MENVRQIKKGELEDLLELYHHLHTHDEPPPIKSKLNSIWENISSNSLLHYFVIEEGGKLVSSCTLSIIPNLTRGARPYGIIENVVTHKEYRRKGLGTAVLKHALKESWKNNCYKVMLSTGRTDSGIFSFYEGAGFKKRIKTSFIAYKE